MDDLTGRNNSKRRAPATVLGLAASVLVGCPDLDKLAECRDCGSHDASSVDSPQDAPYDASQTDCPTDASVTYGDMLESSRWATFDLSKLAPRAVLYSGGAFDGRYVYFAPNG